MTYDQAVEMAKKVSRETGCVQHVDEHSHEQGYRWADTEVWYVVSDWYDYETTVISFVNGQEV